MAPNTAFGAGTMKALEWHVPPDKRLYDDPVAERLLSGLPARLVRNPLLRLPFTALLERVEPGLLGGMVCRTRAIDDALRDALAAGSRQVVVLGAGLDTRAYRMPELTGLTVWELDLPGLQSAKKRAVVRALGALPPHVRYVPVDLTAGDPADALSAADFDTVVPAVAVWEGVSQYLPRDAVDAVLDLPFARLIFTYVVEGPGYARSARRLHWLTPLDPGTLAGELARHELRLVQDVGTAEYQKKYLEPLGRRLAVSELERVAVAESRR